MERNLETEFDLLRKEFSELKNLLVTKNLQVEQQTQKNKHDGFVRETEEGKIFKTDILKELTAEIKQHCQNTRTIGSIATVGYFNAGAHAGGCSSEWCSFTRNSDDLLSLIENRMAEKVLLCIGSNDRLNILLALLKQPHTVANLVENCGYTSPGQVYNHLRPLIAADLVFEDKKPHLPKGTYVVRPYRVPGIMMLLEGIKNMIDTRNTIGNWDKACEDCNGELE